ncbi:ABC transporter ATP-binding protein [Deferrisoma sp.]
MAEIFLDAVTKRFGRVEALRDLSLQVGEGELLVLLGPSGCGKSTALRIVAGLEAPTSGGVWIGGQRVDGMEPGKRDLAFVFQTYALYPHKTVAENLAFPLRVRKVPREQVEAKVREAALLLGIEDLLGRRPRELSGGQRQRVALGRAIVRQPRAFLMDEPLSNLDARLRVEMRSEIRRLQRRLGTTTVYVTHDQVEAMTLGDRVAVLREGRLQQVGTPREVFELPANRFVAGFVGSPPMNLVRAHVERSGRGAALHLAGQVLTWPEGWDVTPPPPGALDLGFRAHSVRLGSGPGLGPLRARVRLREYLGESALLHLEAENHRFTVVRPPNAREEPGDETLVYLRPGELVGFDVATGGRVWAAVRRPTNGA